MRNDLEEKRERLRRHAKRFLELEREEGMTIRQFAGMAGLKFHVLRKYVQACRKESDE